MMLALVIYIIRLLKRRNSGELQTEAVDHCLTRIVVGRPRKEDEREGRRNDEECITIGDIQFPMKE